MRVALYEYIGGNFLRPQYHIISDTESPDCVETMRLHIEERAGGPVIVEKVAETDWVNEKHFQRWLDQQVAQREREKQ